MPRVFHTICYAQHTVRRCPGTATSPESPGIRFGEKDFSWTPCVFALLIGQETLTTPKDECACPLLLSSHRRFPDLLIPVVIRKVNSLFSVAIMFKTSDWLLLKSERGGLKLVTDVTNWQQSYLCQHKQGRNKIALVTHFVFRSFPLGKTQK